MKTKKSLDFNTKRKRKRVLVRLNGNEKNEDEINNNINKNIAKRKDLIDQLELIKLLKKREKLKLEIIKKF